MSESGPESGAAGSDRRSDRSSGLPPMDSGDQEDDQRSTTALPRPAGARRVRYPFDPRSASPAGPTTALPRHPPAAGDRPAPPPTAFRSGYRDAGAPSNGDRPPGYGGAGYGGPGHGGPGYGGAGYGGTAHDDHGYTGAAYSDGAPQPSGYTGASHTGAGYTGASHPRAGYTGASYTGAGYTGPGYTGTGDRGDLRSEPPVGQAPVGPSWAPQHPYHPQPAPTGPPYRGPQDHDHYGRQDAHDDEPPQDRPQHRPPPRGSHLPPYSEPLGAGSTTPKTAVPPGIRSPRKLTVTRVAALRSRELTTRGVQMFHKATTADGADKSGLTSLTYAVMANYAVDAALAVALAGTLFFAAATAESTGRVLLYLVITVAPFAVIAPFIGPMLDRLQSGRRLALALSSFGRALLAVLMAFNFSHFNPWVIYPCALGNLVLSKAFGVLKAALTPRVLPTQITLVKTNSRLTTFGMIAGGVAGALAAGLSKITGSPGALFFTAACAIAGGVLCLRIPAWVESTEGEVPVKEPGSGPRSKSFPQIVTATLWANSMIRVETGFLALFIAFVVKSQYPAPQHSAFTQLLLLGVVGGAAGVGGFVGNTMGARLTLSSPETISIFALVGVLVSTVVAVLVPGLTTAAIVGFVGSTASALAKVSLDSVIQHHLPEESRASAFGKSESVLQLGWVFGGVVGLLLGGVWVFGHDSVYAIGFGTITLLLAAGLAQSYLVRSGRSMVPSLRGRGGGRSSGRTGRGHRTSRSGRTGDTGLTADTDRLARPASGATAPAGEASAPPRRPRKAGGDR